MEMDTDEFFNSFPPPPGQVRIRPDLANFFEVVNHEEKTLKCKLAGQGTCKTDGVNGVLKHNRACGWHNFERHLINVHKVPKELFFKGPKSSEVLERNEEIVRNVLSGLTNSSIKTPSVSVGKKKCVVCLSKISGNGADKALFENHLQDLFPGGQKNVLLNRQLFHAFFLCNILNFPKSMYEKLISRANQTWFAICGNCEQIVVNAAIIHKDILALKHQLENVQNSVVDKIRASANNSEAFSELNHSEKSIRSFVCGTLSESTRDGVKRGPLSKKFPKASRNTSLYQEHSTSTLFKTDTFIQPNAEEYDDTINEVVLVKVELDDGIVSETTGTDEFPWDPSDRDYEPEVDDVAAAADLEYDDDPEFLPTSKKNLKAEKKRDVLAKSKIKRTRIDTNLQLVAKKFKKKTFRKHKPVHIVEDYEKHDDFDKVAKLFLCKLCPAKYPYLSVYKRHLKEHEANEKLNREFECDECGFPCISQRSKNNHKNLKHKKQKPVVQVNCNLCKFVAPSKMDLMRHQKEHKKIADKECIDGKYLCTFCNRLFLTYALLCKHKRLMHHQEIGWQPIVCTICESSPVFSHSRGLKDHIMQVHKNQSKYYCDICGQGFMYSNKLKRHMNKHNQETAFVCEICGADYNYSETLKKHILKCHPESELAFDPTNSQSFINIIKKRDIESNEDNAVHVCKHCGIECASSALLVRHAKSHFNYKCDVCGKKYISSQNLRRHISINHSSQEVPCSYCNKSFSHPEYVRAHLKYCSLNPNKPDTKKVLGIPVESLGLKLDLNKSNADPLVSATNVFTTTSEAQNIH